jgi:CubicO group peptidase (beta-lactamase class C family)
VGCARPVFRALFLLVLAGVAPAPARAGAFDERIGQGVDPIMAKALADGDAPGAVVLAVHEGRIVFERGYGFPAATSPRGTGTDVPAAR